MGFHRKVSAFYMSFLLTQALPGAPKAQKDNDFMIFCVFAPWR
ncbi:hypothetical protein AB3662_25450 [Sorangium cellulosum]